MQGWLVLDGPKKDCDVTVVLSIEFLPDGQAFKPVRPHVSQLPFDADFVE
jgi:hypothetical protein